MGRLTSALPGAAKRAEDARKRAEQRKKQIEENMKFYADLSQLLATGQGMNKI